jgi:diaminohydroxyphosphoribosylaminopyrimidine deaminase / 5-amino-6-(5-phosphoribosylamino)uracil reductase
MSTRYITERRAIPRDDLTFVNPMRTSLPDDVAMQLDLYLPYCLSHPRGLAVAHIGQSLDGRIATENGESRWITGEADLLHCHTHAGARRRGPCRCPHRGADDPQLTVRRCAGDNPFRVVIDPELSLTGRHGIFRDRAAPTLIVAAKEHGDRRGDAWELAWSRNGAICASANCRHA